MALRANEHNVGYMPVNGYVSKSSRVEQATRPNLVEAFFVKRDLPPDHRKLIQDWERPSKRSELKRRFGIA